MTTGLKVSLYILNENDYHLYLELQLDIPT
jgi:hypothetical protein